MGVSREPSATAPPAIAGVWSLREGSQSQILSDIGCLNAVSGDEKEKERERE